MKNYTRGEVWGTDWRTAVFARAQEIPDNASLGRIQSVRGGGGGCDVNGLDSAYRGIIVIDF